MRIRELAEAYGPIVAMWAVFMALLSTVPGFVIFVIAVPDIVALEPSVTPVWLMVALGIFAVPAFTFAVIAAVLFFLDYRFGGP